MTDTFTMKDLFKLACKHDENKIDFNSKTIDRRGGDIEVGVFMDDRKFTSANELYNYIINKNKDLRDYSDEKEFNEIVPHIVKISPTKIGVASVLSFTVGYMDFEITAKLKKE